MRAVLVLLLGAMLAGCASTAPFPEAYLPTPLMMPDGYELVPEDSEFWDEVADDLGVATNPGTMDPAVASEFFDLPEAASVHFVIYYRGPVDDPRDILYGMAFAYQDRTALQEWLAEGTGMHCDMGRLLVNGNRVAIVAGSADGHVNEVADRVQTSSGSRDWCQELVALEAQNASPLEMGDNGPFSIDAGGHMFFRLQHSGGRLELETSGNNGDSLMALYDSDMSIVERDDDGGDEMWSRIAREVPAGRYFVKISGYDGEPIRDFYLHWG